MFHNKCGDSISLRNNNKTAVRSCAEFNQGVVFSKEPLLTNHLFEVRIDKKILSWSGGLEFGVTKSDPDYVTVPSSISNMRMGTWVLSNNEIIKDGRIITTDYEIDLNEVDVGDVIGVMRTDQDELVFSLNGECKGVAARSLPLRLFVILDLYGQVFQTTIVSYAMCPNSFLAIELDMYDDSDITEGNSLLSHFVTNFDGQSPITSNERNIAERDRLRFHRRCGELAKISHNGRSAERLRPLDEFNNGVIITKRPLNTEELFEIRIDRLINKWSGSVEMGVTMHNPDFLSFPPTATNLRTGTIMMSGSGILTNGRATKRDYGEFSLDVLMVGDRIGIIRKQNGNLHYIINGIDQGVAASSVPELFWGVVDLYGRTVKVTIVDRDEREEYNLVARRAHAVRSRAWSENVISDVDEDSDDSLVFHPKCGSHVTVINNNRTAYRPNALEDFNNGVVLTSRPLKPNESFEVKLDKIVSKWAGSIEIGVTSHSPSTLEFPSTMTNVRSGTWMMTGNGVMHNGTTVMDDYGVNLDRLQVADRVAVVIKDNGSLHFFVNGIDQGQVTANISGPMYGVIDLYGQAAQATIIDYDMLCCCVTPSEAGHPLTLQNHSDVHFHHVHGNNVRICNGGRTALRPQPFAEFTDAVVISNRPLKDNELFAVSIERVIDRWNGSIEMGITAIKPDELDIPTTMTDVDHDTWMLSGQTITKNGIPCSRYALNLDMVQVGMLVGIMKYPSGVVHFYLDGVDQGSVFQDVHGDVYPVIDLYGQCAQVTIVSPPEQKLLASGITSNNTTSRYQSATNLVDMMVNSNQLLFYNPQWSFHEHCGKSIELSDDCTTATRVDHNNGGLVFSNYVLELDKLFEVMITKWNAKFAGTLSIGVTTFNPEKGVPDFPISHFWSGIWYLNGDEVWHNRKIIKSHYGCNLYWLRRWSTVGIKCCLDGTVHFYINGQDQGIAVQNIPSEVYAVIDLQNAAVEITISRDMKDIHSAMHSVNVTDSFVSSTSSTTQETPACKEVNVHLKAERAIMEYYLMNNFLKEKPAGKLDDKNTDWLFFGELRGRNIRLINNGKTAIRCDSYNQGVVIVSNPLERNTVFEVIVEKTNLRWVSSIAIGILCSPLTRSSLPLTAFGFKKGCWLISGDSVYHNGVKIKSRYGVNLESIIISQKVGIMVDSNNQLHLFVDSVDQGVAATNIPPVCYVILDLYGKCEQVSIAMELEPRMLSVEPEVAEDVHEKAVLEHHEKETPSEEDNSLDGKWCKTYENNAVAQSRTERRDQRDFSSSDCGNFLSLDAGSLACYEERCGRSLTSSVNQYAQLDIRSVSANELSRAENTLMDRKSITASVNLHLRSLEQRQASDVRRHSIEHSWNDAINMRQQADALSPVSDDIRPKRKSINEGIRKIRTKTEELAVLESVESVQRPKMVEKRLRPKQNPHCEYRLLCARFKADLMLPDGFFGSEAGIVCYCNECYPIEMQEQKGDPPSSYSVPNGWCKFPLKKHLMTNNVDALTLEKWHVAFAGIAVGNIRRTLDSGRLLALNKNKAGVAAPIISSPTIKYAGSNSFAPNSKYVDKPTKVMYSCKAAFQILVRPESYLTSAPSVDVSSEIFDMDVNIIEWSIVETGNMVLSALLLNMEKLQTERMNNGCSIISTTKENRLKKMGELSEQSDGISSNINLKQLKSFQELQ